MTNIMDLMAAVQRQCVVEICILSHGKKIFFKNKFAGVVNNEYFRIPKKLHG